MNFEYGSEAIEHLERRDKRLGDAIDQIGPIHRKTEMGLSAGVVSILQAGKYSPLRRRLYESV